MGRILNLPEWVPPDDISVTTLLIAGSAPCLHADLDRAKILRPQYSVMALNDAARWTPCDYLFSLHPEKMKKWASEQRIFNTHFQLHAGLENDRELTDCPWVDYWWVGVIVPATSAGAAVLVALKMGFPEVILCGCPMTGGDGYAGPTERGCPSNPRFGFKAPESSLIRSYREGMGHIASLPDAVHVYSMSGYTQEKFGTPPEVAHYGHISN